MSISKNIKKLRLEHNLSQKEFAKIAGVSDKAVSTWENGTKEPRMGTIQKIADFFGIKKSDIIEDNDDNLPELTSRDERDIKKHLDKALENLENDEALMFDGEPVEMDTETKELLKASLENSIRLAKTLAKKKYTPKKYQKNDKSDD